MIAPLLMMSEAAAAEGQEPAQVLIDHVHDGSEWTLPFIGEVDLNKVFGDWTIAGIPLTPTRFTVVMFIGAIALVSILLWSMRGRGQVPKGRLQTTVEIFYLFIRDEIAEKNIGHGYKRYVPYLASVFFFILTMNLIGLIPYMATPTGNLAVTGVLAAFTFLITQLAGMRAQGVVGYWTHLVPSGVPLVLYPLFIPIELVGLFTKPFALMMRLFANMLAGHIVIYFLIGLIFILKTLLVAPVAIPFAFAIFLLEIFVAFLQAYIFTILSSVFIGLAGHAH
jgi:F-type H+-transporting ATPase subunit a